MTCSIEDCGAPRYCRGWCTRHYERWRRHGDPTTVVAVRKPDECTIDGCDRPVNGRGLCHAHYRRWHVYGDPLVGGPIRTPQPDECTVEGCDRKPKARGLCHRHYKSSRYANDPEYRERVNAQWRDWAERNAEKRAVWQREYRAANAERVSARMAQWRDDNADRVLANNWRRRRRSMGLSEAVVDLVDPRVVYERDGWICQLCNNPVDPELTHPDPLSATIDHTIPVRLPESSHSYANTALAHWDCNRRKQGAVLAVGGGDAA